MENYKNAAKFGVFTLFAGGFYWYAKKIRQSKKQYRSLRDVPVKSLKDITSNKKGEQMLVKVMVASGPQISFDQNVYSNQIYFVEPSDKVVLEKFRKKLQTQNFQWVAKSGVDKKANTREVKNFGKVFGDVFDYARKFQQHQLGTLATIREYISYFGEFIIDLFSNSRKNSQKVSRKPIIMGPLKGILHYQVSLITGSFLVLKCKVDDDGKLIASMTASSKDVVLQHYWRQIRQSYIMAMITIVGLIISGKLLYQFFRVKYTQWKTKLLADSGVYLSPKDLSDDKLCIICYDACRNAVFLDCRHCVLCAGCSKVYKQQVCPICKNEIDCVKLIYNC